MRTLVPFDARDPNTRLDAALDKTERLGFARAMCRDVLAAVREAGHDPELLATASFDCDATVIVDERPLSRAVNAVLADADEPVTVVMADLPLVTPTTIERLVSPEADIVIGPGLGGGTNALVVRHPEFRVDYHGGSVRKHRDRAEATAGTYTTVDSFRLAVDIDDPSDLAEVLLHSDGSAASWLREAGFELTTRDGRLTATRPPDTG